jgi:hypothetical protein
VLFDVLVVAGEVDADDFKASSDNCMDGHSSKTSQLGETYCYLVHLYICILFGFRLLFIGLCVKCCGSFDVGKQANIIVIDSL